MVPTRSCSTDREELNLLFDAVAVPVTQEVLPAEVAGRDQAAGVAGSGPVEPRLIGQRLRQGGRPPVLDDARVIGEQPDVTKERVIHHLDPAES